MKKFLLLFTLSLYFVPFSYGQLALYNTRTLYDAFENPSQKAFYADSSRRFAFNFLIPTLSANGAVSGEAQTAIKRLLYSGKLSAASISSGNEQPNRITLTENTYIAMFKIFKKVRFHREVGFAWQVRSDTYGEISNETIAFFQNYKNISPSNYQDLFNNQGHNINYHQFSYTYREDYDKRLGLGVKLSYLSGIAYNELDIGSSSLRTSPETDAYTLSLDGKYRSNVSWKDKDPALAIPGIKNPGLALSLSANYKLRGGWYILGNLKDLGFIRWGRKEAYTYDFDDEITLTAASAPTANSRLGSKINKRFNESSFGSYTTPINGKAEFLINKDFGKYQPHLFLSKNLFYPGGDIALINRLQHRAMNFSLTTAYNLNNFFQLGGQFMLKSPNAELFIGSDQLLESYYTAKGLFTKNENIGRGTTAAAVYFGFALKFGPFMERWQNANNIPGIESEVRPGFFRRMFGGKKR
jgi:hypothetical protein